MNLPSIVLASVMALALASFLLRGRFRLGKAQKDELKRLASEGAHIVDVRTPDEYAGGHVREALNIPHDQIEKRATDLGAEKERPVILYCANGDRAAVAKRKLEGLGFTRVADAGGYADLNNVLGC